MYDLNTKALLPIHRVFFCFSFILMLASCESLTVRGTTEPSERPAEIPTQVIDPATQKKINQLLDEAYLAYENDRLTTPLDDNAYYRYLRVFSMDPANRFAEQGLTEIVEKYLAWAIDSAELQHFRSAVDYLNKARSIDETHPNISAVERQILDRRSATHEIYHLETDALDSRHSDLITQLHTIARMVELKQATVVITARNDPEGRWIYQQLNDATGTRVHATFETGRRPSIHLRFIVPENQ